MQCNKAKGDRKEVMDGQNWTDEECEQRWVGEAVMNSSMISSGAVSRGEGKGVSTSLKPLQQNKSCQRRWLVQGKFVLHKSHLILFCLLNCHYSQSAQKQTGQFDFLSLALDKRFSNLYLFRKK